jgi:hypothetical protein
MSWWKRTRKTEPVAEAPRPSEQPETDAEAVARFRREYRAKDRRDREESVRQEQIQAEQQARRDRAQRELELRVIARNGCYFPGDRPDEIRDGGLSGRGFGVPPAWAAYQAELDDVWRGQERESYQAHQWD